MDLGEVLVFSEWLLWWEVPSSDERIYVPSGMTVSALMVLVCKKRHCFSVGYKSCIHLVRAE
jgi:hypothetical protein